MPLQTNIRSQIALFSFIVVVFIVGLLFTFSNSFAATTITVSTPADELNDDGDCSLREAIQSANNDSAIDACPAGSGVDTIIIPSGIYTLALAGASEDMNNSGDLDITSAVIIEGNGSDATIIDGGGIDRIFHIHGSINVEINNMTIRNGHAPDGSDGDMFNSAEYGESGGSIFNNRGNLTINSNQIVNNTAGHGGDCFDDCSGGGGGHGGAIYNNGGSITVQDSTFSNNHGGNGGSGSTIFGGDGSGGNGGAIYNHPYTGADATLTIIRSTLNNNEVGIGGNASGGAIFTHGSTSNNGTVNLINSTLSGNSSTFNGGGIYNLASGGHDLVTISNSTIAYNTADSDGDGSGEGGGVSNWTGSNVVIRNSIIAANNDNSSGTKHPDCHGTMTSQDYNLIQDTTGCSFTGQTSNHIIGVSAQLLPLADNGGYSFTHALQNDSPALDSGNPVTPGSDGTACEAVDQRYYSRPANGQCDIGAFENSATAVATPTYSPTVIFTVTPTNSPTSIPTFTPSPTATPTNNNLAKGTFRISVASDGTEANADSRIVSISGNGRYVAFYSQANNLGSGDEDNHVELFIHDRETGITENVPGSKLYSWTTAPDFSFNGRYLVFIANDVIGGNVWKVCIYDQQIKDVSCIYLGDFSVSPKISGNGRFITFSSGAENLVTDDNNNRDDVFVYDRETTEISRISVASNGDEGDANSGYPDISYDGRYITFTSDSKNFSTEDIDEEADIFLHDRQTAETTLISFPSPLPSSVPGIYRLLSSASISDDARFIVVSAQNSRPVPNNPDIPTIRKLYIHDTQTHVTTSLLSSSSHQEPMGAFYTPVISGEGNHVVFMKRRDPSVSYATPTDVFVVNRLNGIVQLASVSSVGTPGNNDSGYDRHFGIDISYDGQSIVFESFADNLISNDHNDNWDIFVRQLSNNDLKEIAFGQISLTQRDVLSGNLEPLPIEDDVQTTVEGNNVLATFDIQNASDEVIKGHFAILDTTLNPPTEVTIGAPIALVSGDNAFENIQLETDGMAYDSSGQRTPQRTLVVEISLSSGEVISKPITLGVRPRPVVLVHGLTDDETGWNDYAGPTGFLNSMGIDYCVDDVADCAVDTLDTGKRDEWYEQIGWRTNSIDENAQLLDAYIQQIKVASNAHQVDIVSHSMGGLISRRYIARYMSAWSPDVNQLIMLGTPNEGSESAEAVIKTLFQTSLPGSVASIVGWNYPAVLELTPTYLRHWNIDNFERYGVPFYAVAGHLEMDADCLINPLEPDPNDIIVWRESVFAVPMNGGWTYPSIDNGSCRADHRKMRSKGEDQGGEQIFNEYVRPLLEGRMPSHALEVSENARTNQPFTENDEPPIQYTKPQTVTLFPDQKLELTFASEPGMDSSFIVVGPSTQFIMSLEAPSGQVITSTTFDSNITYLQIEDGLLPLTSYSIQDIAAGNWKVFLEANDQTPNDGIDLAITMNIASPLQLIVSEVENVLYSNKPVVVNAQLQADSVPIVGAIVDAQLIYPDGSAHYITLYDDGLHGDGDGDDGLYGYEFIPDQAGVYAANIMASGNYNDSPFDRIGLWTVSVEESQDYMIFLPAIMK